MPRALASCPSHPSRPGCCHLRPNSSSAASTPTARTWPILDAVLAAARWEVQVTVRRGDDGLDFGGPFVRGDRTDRHLGIVWGDVTAGGTFRLIRGSKLKLAEVDPALVAEAMRPGSRLVARVRIRPPDLAWSWSVAHA